MKYIADGLPALRVLSAAIVLLAIWQDMWTIATLVFFIGFLTDAFDETAALVLYPCRGTGGFVISGYLCYSQEL